MRLRSVEPFWGRELVEDKLVGVVQPVQELLWRHERVAHNQLVEAHLCDVEAQRVDVVQVVAVRLVRPDDCPRVVLPQDKPARAPRRVGMRTLKDQLDRWVLCPPRQHIDLFQLFERCVL